MEWRTKVKPIHGQQQPGIRSQKEMPTRTRDENDEEQTWDGMEIFAQCGFIKKVVNLIKVFLSVYLPLLLLLLVLLICRPLYLSWKTYWGDVQKMTF